MTTTEPRTGHRASDIQCGIAGAAQAASDSQVVGDPHDTAAVTGPTSPATADAATPIEAPSPGITFSVIDQSSVDTQTSTVGDAHCPPAPASSQPTSIGNAPVLADPFLALAADVLDDLERVRIANENRLRQLTRSTEDKDGEERGFGLTLDHPDVARLAALVKALADAEHQAELNLKRQLRKHPLGPWVKQAHGVGEKQAARLLASISDPYWNDLHNRPRLVSELWSYCGYGDAVVQVRRRGEKSNWSTNAKMRAHLVAVSIVKAGGPYREVYDAGRVKYTDAVHVTECRRCGPSGKPAQPGSPVSLGHQHARALRAVCKEVLRDLWREARRLHELPGGQRGADAQMNGVAGVSNSSAGQCGCGTQARSASGGPT